MKNSKSLFHDFVNRITLPESRDEIQSIAYLVFEQLFGLSKTEVLAGREMPYRSIEYKLDEIIMRLNKHEPVQYILGEAAFYGRTFTVNPSVLIPRPETEELIQLVIDFLRQFNKKNCRILDVGTGSGCIAITLALELPKAKIFATDVSADALRMAAHNAERLEVQVEFMMHDILKSELPDSYDVITSNPPYISWSEQNTLSKNVVDYEPEVALFVDSTDPLLFYKTLIKRACISLRPDGLLVVEIHERAGKDVHDLFVGHNLQSVQVIQDVFGKDRFVKGMLSS